MRSIDPAIITFLKSRKPYKYAHLVKFERPIIASQDLNTTEKQYVYLTDATTDLYFNDPRVDSSAENLAIKYRANRIMDIPAIQEYSKARATSLDLRLDGAAIGTTLADSVTVTSSAVKADGNEWSILFSYPVYNKGIVPGDKLNVELNGVISKVNVLSFPSENVMIVKEVIPTTAITAGVKTLYIELVSEELIAILQDKFSDEYASFINREVSIYKVYFDEETGARIGTPYYLYRGIIQDVSLDDDDGKLIINWTLNSHWGDFSEVKGRMTSDEFHRALDERGIPQPEVAIKPMYASDRGFIHADTAVHLEATYSVQVEKQNVKYKKGFFGIGAKVKVKKYFAAEDRQTELDFQLQGKTLDVLYGVRPAEGTPIFADTLVNDSNEIFVAYAICEGQVGGLYDLIIQDKSLICNNKADADTRSSQTSENTVDVICYGRSDRGDVLNGVTSTTTAYSNFYNADYVGYENTQSGTLVTNSFGYSQPLSVSSGSIGVLHENSIRLTAPINMTIDFYTGTPDQRAAPNLAQYGQSASFKVQNDYWIGNKMDYWGPNHRLLDTAYVVAHYTIGENETTIPSLKMVIKGKFINCYNYDYTYQHWDKANTESAANFNVGDTVDVYNYSNVLIGTNRIVGKFNIRNKNGVLETRFRLKTQPVLGYVNGIPSITKFYIKKGANTWSMVTFNHVEATGTIDSAQSETVTSVTDSGGAAIVTLPASQTIIPQANITDNLGYPRQPAMRFRGSS